MADGRASTAVAQWASTGRRPDDLRIWFNTSSREHGMGICRGTLLKSWPTSGESENADLETASSDDRQNPRLRNSTTVQSDT